MVRGFRSSFILITLLLLLSGCGNLRIDEMTLGNVWREVFKVNAGSKDVEKLITESVYSEYDRERAIIELEDIEVRFAHQIKKYQKVVDELWEREGYYKRMENISGDVMEKESLIDFYLFMEYHKDTQLRNLQFPLILQKDLLMIEVLLARKAIDYIDGYEFHHYGLMKEDLLKIYRDMCREEILNILFEGKQQLVVMDRIPNIMSRYDSEFKNKGMHERLEYYLGIPDTVISRGMGLDLVTLYSEMGYLHEGDMKKLAIILTMEMKLTGIEMRLERFFHVTNSLEGLGEELVELRKDVDLITVDKSLEWVRKRMLRSIDHLEDLYLYYKGDKEYTDIKDVFIKLKTREDFYALGMLGKSIRDVMDREDYWLEVEKIRSELSGRKNQ